MQKLIDILDKAGLLSPAQKRALALKKREAQLRASLKRYDVLGVGYTPKIKNFKSIAELDSAIPFTQECSHSWAYMDSISTLVKLAIIRDGKFMVIESRNHEGFYSDNGTITSQWEYHWDDPILVGDIILAVHWRSKGEEFREEVDEAEYIILRHPLVYGKDQVEVLAKKWEELKELF